ncbi:N utilization substance protein B [Kineococcus xinjiangensis]|uniref:Transcription antitermination protein NusB n=1 Tax=Kineococcus xinjiangensis TaxID=512762 RepID=A0A2S6IPK5_9ACTN|nr:transcription antitermination factor NusB [Kineococcus xinjiangensis]PPK96026.1 N utilization substance protein B [Kineococcus xinjiangensis]
MSARTKARRRALDVLFEAEQRQVPARTVLAERAARAEQPFNEYTGVLVEGVEAERARIDELLATYAQGWTLERMPAVDRNVLRLGTWEVLYNPDVPDGVAISEAVGLVRELSTDASPGFVNGLLARLAELKPTIGA